MPIYVTQGSFTRDAIKGMVAKPEDRAAVVAEHLRRVGGRLLGYYFALGEYDFMVISEAPGNKEYSSALLAGIAGGGITDVKTTVAMTSLEAKTALAEAAMLSGSFRSAGSA